MYVSIFSLCIHPSVCHIFDPAMLVRPSDRPSRFPPILKKAWRANPLVKYISHVNCAFEILPAIQSNIHTGNIWKNCIEYLPLSPDTQIFAFIPSNLSTLSNSPLRSITPHSPSPLYLHLTRPWTCFYG